MKYSKMVGTLAKNVETIWLSTCKVLYHYRNLPSTIHLENIKKWLCHKKWLISYPLRQPYDCLCPDINA